MLLAKRILSSIFLVFILLATWQCAKRGSPSGGPKDTTPPVQIGAEPEEFTTEFEAKNIRLYFDEYIRLENPQDQLIISPPLKYLPLLSPQGGASKYVEVTIKDTLKENTTYTINFGQSIVDNNESNPAPFLSYVFSTGTYIDSLTLSGVVTDAFNRLPDNFISIMLYELDTTYTDSTIYQKPPTYISNTLDSLTTFTLQNLKAGSYKLVAVKDQGKNNLFDQDQDKIGFIEDTITLPTDSVYTLNLFREIRDFSMSQPSLVSGNKIIFGYTGGEESIDILPLTILPDSMKTLVLKEYEKDTLNYWFSPPLPDSIVFQVRNDARDYIDTFTVKSRELAADSLVFNPSHSRRINLEEEFQLLSNTPLIQADTSAISIIDQDSILVSYVHILDTLNNRVTLKFNKEPNSGYTVRVMPNAYTNFFGQANDTLFYRLGTSSLADYGNLRLNLIGESDVPVLVQLTSDRGETLREHYMEEVQSVDFNALEPATYRVRIIFDGNKNGKWDTGSYLQKKQPERVLYYPQAIEVRANWELEQSFILRD